MEKLEDIDEIKNNVLIKVAEYAYQGTLLENLDKIPYEIIPSVSPKFRCCVYREREIIRQRVLLARGQSGLISEYLKIFRQQNTNNSTKKVLQPSQIVHVIPSACEGCHIDRISVTSNCQKCLAQKCVKSCKFDAIIKTPLGAIIDKQKCVNCGACAKACPYNAIVDIERPCKKSCPVDAITMDENNLALINEEKCINCGACILGCPFGAISDTSMIVDVIDKINEGKRLYAIVAPSIEGQFGDVPVGVLKEAIKALGFIDVYEVALGADAVAYREADELVENFEKGRVMTSSCCPGFVNLIKQHYPSLVENISTSVSPMVATGRYVKTIDSKALVVFIGPCVTKKNEAIVNYPNEIEYVLTFEELLAMFEAKKVELMTFDNQKELASSFGKGFAKAGGVTNAVLKVLEEKNINLNIKTLKCNGAADCKKALLMLKAGKLPENFIEGMACEHGCINGPSRIKDVNVSRKIFDKYTNENSNNSVTEVNKVFGLDKLEIHIK